MLRLAPLVLLLVLAACATPVAPTGGPVDTTPPSLVEVSPADGTTNVSDPTVVLTFSERLSSRSGSAVTVTPAGDVPVEVSIRGRDITLRIPELRDSTTYVVTVGTELQDQRNVALRSPITVAFSTGDEIDAGRLSGLIRDPRTGQGVGSMAVWAYALA
ncbi:MAG: Ig-like domain-containing protein, partial [Bacteroidota bacterium]